MGCEHFRVVQGCPGSRLMKLQTGFSNFKIRIFSPSFQERTARLLLSWAIDGPITPSNDPRDVSLRERLPQSKPPPTLEEWGQKHHTAIGAQLLHCDFSLHSDSLTGCRLWTAPSCINFRALGPTQCSYNSLLYTKGSWMFCCNWKRTPFTLDKKPCSLGFIF